MTQEDHCDLLLTGGIVITIDEQRRVLDPGAIGIKGEQIAAVGSVDELADYKAKRVIDCSDKLITPGFIDCHNHLSRRWRGHEALALVESIDAAFRRQSDPG